MWPFKSNLLKNILLPAIKLYHNIKHCKASMWGGRASNTLPYHIFSTAVHV